MDECVWAAMAVKGSSKHEDLQSDHGCFCATLVKSIKPVARSACIDESARDNSPRLCILVTLPHPSLHRRVRAWTMGPIYVATFAPARFLGR